MGIKKRETVALEAGGSSGHTWSQIVFEVTAMANNQKKKESIQEGGNYSFCQPCSISHIYSCVAI